jgi:hypothetical protein
VLEFSPRHLHVLLPEGHANDLPGSIAGNRAGDVAVAWLRYAHLDDEGSVSGLERLQVAVLRRGARRFGRPITVVNGRTRPADPVVGIDAKGNVTAAWASWPPPDRLCCVVVMSSTRSAGAPSFKPPQAVGLPSTWSSVIAPFTPDPAPSVAVAPSGAAVITYTHAIGQSAPNVPGSPPSLTGYTVDNEMAYRPPGGGFGPSLPLGPTEPSEQASVETATSVLDPDGTAYVYWNYPTLADLQAYWDDRLQSCGPQGSVSDVWLASRRAAGPLTPAYQLPPPPNGSPKSVYSLAGMAFLAPGRPLAVLTQSTIGRVSEPTIPCATISSQIAVATLRPDGTMSAARVISHQNVLTPEVADNGTGRVAIVWSSGIVACTNPWLPNSAIRVSTIGMAGGRNPDPHPVVQNIRFGVTPSSKRRGRLTVRLTSTEPGIATLSARRHGKHRRTVRWRFRVHRGVNVIRIPTRQLGARHRPGMYTFTLLASNLHGRPIPPCSYSNTLTARVP